MLVRPSVAETIRNTFSLCNPSRKWWHWSTSVKRCMVFIIRRRWAMLVCCASLCSSSVEFNQMRTRRQEPACGVEELENSADWVELISRTECKWNYAFTGLRWVATERKAWFCSIEKRNLSQYCRYSNIRISDILFDASEMDKNDREDWFYSNSFSPYTQTKFSIR